MSHVNPLCSTAISFSNSILTGHSCRIPPPLYIAGEHHINLSGGWYAQDLELCSMISQNPHWGLKVACPTVSPPDQCIRNSHNWENYFTWILSKWFYASSHSLAYTCQHSVWAWQNSTLQHSSGCIPRLYHQYRKVATQGSTSIYSLHEKLLNTLTRFGCRHLPTPSNLLKCLHQIAQYEFCCKPAAAIALIHSGTPATHSQFWNTTSADGSIQVIDCICKQDPQCFSVPWILKSCWRTWYLVDMIRNMTDTELQDFLQFTTGSSVLITNKVNLEESQYMCSGYKQSTLQQ